MQKFLPVNLTELDGEPDIILITGDAYIDHPAFGAALLGRVLENAGYRVGIIAQPITEKDFTALGSPKLFFGITSGNMDTMVNKYTAQRKLRSEDAYSPDGKIDLRPERAVISYCNSVRRYFKNAFLVIGGIEASMRRIPHYDYWSDKVRNSILFDAKADVLIYGMAEKPLLMLAEILKKENRSAIENLPQCVRAVKEYPQDSVILPEAEQCREKETFYLMSKIFHCHFQEKVIVQKFDERYLRHNPPASPLTPSELDDIYALPYTKLPHPMYTGKRIKAYEQIKDSLVSHRGCLGGCNFCTIGYHQGKAISSRSGQSILDELARLAKHPLFKGTVTDIGGPSANMYGLSCKKGYQCGRSSCLYPDLCSNLVNNHLSQTTLLQKSLHVPGVKHVFISSGVRYDLALYHTDYLENLTKNHISGYLKLAPEHVSPSVLAKMGKPSFKIYEAFEEKFAQITKKMNKEQYIIPYIIIGHPGETLADTFLLQAYLKKRNLKLKQIQEFTPTPMTISTSMYYTGKDFFTGEDIHVPKGREIRLMKALVQWWKPENAKLISEAEHLAGKNTARKIAVIPRKHPRKK